MGWTYFEKPANISEWFKDLLTWESDKKINTCLKTAIKFKEAYAAVESIDKETGEREVWAAVFMLNYTRDAYYNFGYKDMDETMGPCIANCPASILDLLTPTDSKWANDWREKCRKNANRKPIKIGDTIKFTEPVYNGETIFQKIKYYRYRNVFKSASGALVRLTKGTLNAYEWEHV